LLANGFSAYGCQVVQHVADPPELPVMILLITAGSSAHTRAGAIAFLRRSIRILTESAAGLAATG
jgi:hypothetical protein